MCGFAVSVASPFLWLRRFCGCAVSRFAFQWLRRFSLRCLNGCAVSGFLCLRRFNGFAVSRFAVSMPAAFNFVEGFAVLCLRRFNGFAVSRFAVSSFYVLRTFLAALFLGLGLFANIKKGAEK